MTSTVTDEMVEAALGAYVNYATNLGISLVGTHENRRTVLFNAIEAALSVAPSRQPVAGDAVDAALWHWFACDTWASKRTKSPWAADETTRMSAAIAAADRARGFAAPVEPIVISSGFPWRGERLGDWSIVGMNHYRKDGQRHIFVSMEKEGRRIKSEGPDDGRVWADLERHAFRANDIATQSPERRSDDSAPRDAASDDTHETPGVAALAGGADRTLLRALTYAVADLLQTRRLPDDDPRERTLLHLATQTFGDAWTLSAVDSVAFVDALENPPEPNEALKQAAEHYRARRAPDPPPFPPWSAEMAALLRETAAWVNEYLPGKMVSHPLQEYLEAAFTETPDA